MNKLPKICIFLFTLACITKYCVAGETSASLESEKLKFTLHSANGAFELLDKSSGVTWLSSRDTKGFGEVAIELK